MDNCASFEPIAPYFSKLGYRLYCIEFSGHGKSTHRPSSSPILIWVGEIAEVIQQLKLKEFYLMGHSMGAALSSVTASVVKGIKKLILIDYDGIDQKKFFFKHFF